MRRKELIEPPFGVFIDINEYQDDFARRVTTLEEDTFYEARSTTRAMRRAKLGLSFVICVKRLDGALATPSGGQIPANFDFQIVTESLLPARRAVYNSSFEMDGVWEMTSNSLYIHHRNRIVDTLRQGYLIEANLFSLDPDAWLASQLSAPIAAQDQRDAEIEHAQRMEAYYASEEANADTIPIDIEEIRRRRGLS